jgi:hypothetical protein
MDINTLILIYTLIFVLGTIFISLLIKMNNFYKVKLENHMQIITILLYKKVFEEIDKEIKEKNFSYLKESLTLTLQNKKIDFDKYRNKLERDYDEIINVMIKT